jgi:hypothetical protein
LEDSGTNLPDLKLLVEMRELSPGILQEKFPLQEQRRVNTLKNGTAAAAIMMFRKREEDALVWRYELSWSMSQKPYARRMAMVRSSAFAIIAGLVHTLAEWKGFQTFASVGAGGSPQQPKHS